MNLTENLIKEVAKKVLKEPKIRKVMNGKEHEIDLEKPFNKITMYDALSNAIGKNIETVSDDELKRMLDEINQKPRGNLYIRGFMIEKLFDKLVADNIVDPTFILDYPIETTPLCKPHRSKSGLVERFELYAAGMELANAYSELNDPVLQDELFKKEMEMMRRGDEEAHPYDFDFVRALSYGMPPTGGVGIGIDRVVMLLTGVYSIKEIIPYPMISYKLVEEE